MSNYVFTGRQKDLIVSQAMRSDSALNLNGLYSFADPPDEVRLTRAIQQVSAHFLSLRTKVKLEKGELSPCVLEGNVTVEKIIRRTAREQFDEVYRISQHSFDLFSERPMRAYLIGDGERIEHMLLQFHHVATDWWSFRIIHQALTSLYDDSEQTVLENDAVVRSNQASLPLENSAESILFWRTVLEKPLFSRALSNTVKTFHEHSQLTVDVQEMEKIARGVGLTFFEWLFLRFAEAVTQVTGCDTLVNIPVGNRSNVDEIRTVGYLMNVVPIRCQVTNEGFDAEKTLETLRDGIRFGRVPRGQLAQILKHSLGDYGPLFDIVFMFLRDGIGGLHMPGNATFTRIYPGRDEDRFVVTIRELEGQLTIVTEGCGSDDEGTRIVEIFLNALKEI